jgi:carbohydrate diacid regulator
MLLHEHIPPGDIGLFQYDVTMLDLMLQQIPSIHKRHLYQTVFKSCSEDEIEEFCSFIRMYFQCDGSLAEIAKRTYVHKNTVQYKIGKIVRKTSFDLRSHHNLFLLYIAAGFEQPSHQGLAR